MTSKRHDASVRYLLYISFILLVAMIAYLCHTMSSHPYTSYNMSEAYRYGCDFGSRPLSEKDIRDCETASDVFRKILEQEVYGR